MGMLIICLCSINVIYNTEEWPGSQLIGQGVLNVVWTKQSR